MKKFLNILIIFLFTILFFNLFSNKASEKTWLDISFSEKSYTVPASVIVKVSNYSNDSVTLNTCDNIDIRKNWEKIDFSLWDFCKDITVKSNNVEDINYQYFYEKFKEWGKYSLEVNIWDKKFNSEMNISNKWFFSKIFTELVYAPIYNLFVWLISIFQWSFWWAIIFVTIIIRILLLYPQHKSLISQKKLQEIQPKIKKIQEENKWNQQAIWMKVLELYKKEKVNPIGSCGFMFIQLPIIFVLYRIILWIQDYSNAYYLYGFLSNFDISKINFSFFDINLLQVWGIQWIILAVIVWLLQFIQIKFSLSFNKKSQDWKIVLEKKSGEDNYSQMMPDSEMMNKFMLYVLPVMIAIATYTLFAWVGIYWWISTLFMLLQQLFVNKIFKSQAK